MPVVSLGYREMSKKEILKQTLFHKKTPEVPYYLKFAAPV